MPPNDRSENPNNFDAAGKYHIANNVAYIRYYVSHIIQYQFYEKMCTEAGQYDPENPEQNPLYKCDFYKSKAAGDALKSVLQKGDSQPWQETMKEFLCAPNDASCVGEMDAEPLLRYFEPIEKWLDANQAENGWEIGWEGGISSSLAVAGG